MTVTDFNWTAIGFYFLSTVICTLCAIVFLLWKSVGISAKRDLFEIITSPSLSEENIVRYSRQIALREVGISGQVKLNRSKVLVIGAGGLGSPILLYLTGAGIGVIGIVDHDSVSTSNLHRQIIHSYHKNHMSKSLSAREACTSLNPNTRIITYQEPLSIGLIKEIFPLYDVIVDATDNCRSRYLINDAAVYYNKPLVSGAALKWQGHVTVYNYSNGPCYRCIAPRDDNGKVDGTPGGAETFGVLGMMVGVIGCLQSTEVIKIILNDFGRDKDSSSGLPILSGRMLFYNSLSTDNMVRLVQLRNRSEDCRTCGKDQVPFFKNEIDDYKIYKGMELVGDSFFPIPPTKILTCDNIQETINFAKKSEKTINIFDVRPNNLFEISHIKGSINILEDDVIKRLASLGVHANSKSGEITEWPIDSAPLREYLTQLLLISDNSIFIIICLNGVRSFYISTIIQQCFVRLQMEVSNYYLSGGILSIRNKFLPSFPNL
ncbi:adenylyltransferase and sulfurtransferase MOCS3 [Cryptosporidium felis]|nr:adenylyltransferase and sulfurtransferase MOCS3 [Cryptosporidium felis]